MSIATRFLLAAAVYGLMGMVLGMVMGARQDFVLLPVHAHLNLLGWVTLAIYGITYQVFPAMAASRIATTQFYTANIGVIVLMPSLAGFLLGHTGALPAMIAGQILVFAALVMFIVNLWRHRHR